MLDNAFRRWREIEHMLLAGKKLTVSKHTVMYGVGKNAIRKDFDIINEEIPLVTKQGYNGGYFLIDGVGKYQNSLSQEQLKCLEKVAMICGSEEKEILQSIIHEFGPYCGEFT